MPTWGLVPISGPQWFCTAHINKIRGNAPPQKTEYLQKLSKMMLTPLPPTIFLLIDFCQSVDHVTSLFVLEFLTKIMKFQVLKLTISIIPITL